MSKSLWINKAEKEASLARILVLAEYIIRICDEVAPIHVLTMKPEFTYELRAEAQNVCLSAFGSIYESGTEDICSLESYIDMLHTEAIERTQTVHVGIRNISKMLPLMERYGFYKNGSGIILHEDII